MSTNTGRREEGDGREVRVLAEALNAVKGMVAAVEYGVRGQVDLIMCLMWGVEDDLVEMMGRLNGPVGVRGVGEGRGGAVLGCEHLTDSDPR